MSSEKTTNKPWQFQPGVSGNPNGRPPGPNKFTSLKNAFLEAFHRLGGVDSLVEWASKEENKADFYKMIRVMLPREVDVKGQLDVPLQIEVVRYTEKQPLPVGDNRLIEKKSSK